MQQNAKQLLIWIGAIILGVILGLFQQGWIDSCCNFIATVFTRLFQFLAVPTLFLAILTTLIKFYGQKRTKKIFVRTITYTLTTTFAAALLGMILFIVIAPGNIPAESIPGSTGMTDTGSFYSHFVEVIPNNLFEPFLAANVLSVLIVSVGFGIAIAKMEDGPRRIVLINGLEGFQEVFFILIRGLIRVLPLGIVAFSEQLVSQIEGGVILGSLGKWALVILLGNVLQFFVVLPLFLLARGLNPVKVLRAMTPAVLMALFTKSSAATLPVTLSSAEKRLGASSEVARFVLPICTTINMNGCAAFILVTSLFLMQNGGMALSIPVMLIWVLISVFAAVGNAGVPMGCFFLTVSLMTGAGAPVGIMGLILPIYTILDMIETAENVWSDSCVCAMTDSDLKRSEQHS